MSSPSVPHVGPGQGLPSPDIGRLLSSVGYFIHKKTVKTSVLPLFVRTMGAPFSFFCTSVLRITQFVRYKGNSSSDPEAGYQSLI